MKTHEIGKKIKNNKEIKYDKRTKYGKEIKYDKRTIYNKNGFPVVSVAVLALIISGCLFADLITTREPGYMDLANYTKAPGTEFLFGTDTMGRDIFSCIWYGGRVSISIGIISTIISTVIAVIYGSLSAMAGDIADTCMMRFVEILLSIPTLLLVVFLQAVMGDATVASISVVIGLTSWCSIAKIVRTEVKKLKNSEYVIAAKCMGGGFGYILRRHLVPNFIPSIMFMVVMNVRAAIVAESTLSFMGIGLPVDRCVVDNNNTGSISRYISYVPYERGTLDTKQIINCNSKHNPLYYSHSTADFIFGRIIWQLLKKYL